MLKFILGTIKDKKNEIENLIDFELLRDLDAACDGLRVTFLADEELDEICRIDVYSDNTLIFNGYVDTQRMTNDRQGYRAFIYARSSACLLIDNEAEPISYNCPNINTLCYKNALPLGFKWDLPNIAISDYYEVTKGSSCFGVIDYFAKSVSGNGIYVDPFDTIRMLKSEGEFKIDENAIISKKKIINRGSALTTIDYKLSGSDRYNRHLKNKLLEQKGIRRQQKLNLAALPNWQREMIVKNKLKNNAKDYYSCEFELYGLQSVRLCDEICVDNKLGSVDGYYVSKIAYKKSPKGIITKIIGYKNIDLGEINYVAE